MRRAANRVGSTAALLLALGVAGCGSSADSDSGAKPAIGTYRTYLEGRSTKLQADTANMLQLIRADNVAGAQSRYAIARVAFGQLEPASELFPALDRRIDATAANAPSAGLEGFHRVERELWIHNPPDLTAKAVGLNADVRRLARRIRTADLTSARIVHGAREVLNEISTSEVHGKEEPYARIDLVDTAANVEGVEAAYDAVAPVVETAAPDLAAEVNKALAGAYAGVRNFGLAAREPDQPRPGSAGTSFVLYYVRTPAEYRALGHRIATLARALSRVADVVAE